MNRMRTALSLLLALSSAPPVRAQDVDDASRREYYYEAVTEPFYAKDGSSGLYVPRRKYAEYAAPFAVVKSSGTLRVFVVGGSITAYATRWPKPVAYAAGLLGLRFDDLAADLAAALGRPVELINCGMPGYDSYREALVVDEVLGYSPDLILLFSGHNEGIASPPAAAVMLKLQAFLRRSRGYRDLQSRLQAVLGREQAPAESAAARDAAFERNVRDMLDEAKARGVRVGVVAPPLNYRDAPTDDAAPMRDPAFLRGWLAYLRRDDAAAVRAWSAALGAGPARPDAERSLTEFYLARALEGGQGRQAEADVRYEDAMADDADAVGRCSTRCQRILRRAAAAGGAALVDLDGAFKRAAAPLLPGLERFDDAVHWQSTEDALASREIVAAVFPARADRAPSAVRSFGRDRALRTARYAVDLMTRSHGRLSWRAVVYLQAVYRRHPDWLASPALFGRRVLKKPRLPFESGSGADPALLSWLIGEVLLRDGRSAQAIRMFDGALSADSSLPAILLSRATAQLLAGDADGAARSLDEAARKGFAPEASALRSAAAR